MELQYYYEKLHPSYRPTYTRLYGAISQQHPSVSSEGLPPESINEILKCILLDHPELCCFEGNWQYESQKKLVLPSYALSQTQALTAEHAAAAILQAVDTHNALSAPMLAKALFDELLSTVAYDLSAPNSQNIYGSLTEKRAVCKGIAKAYQYLLLQKDIPCILAEGAIHGVGKHVWNMLWLDGQWYHADICMGYPQFQALRNTTDPYNCFLISTQSISHTHVIRHPNLLPNSSQRSFFHE